ncbi:MAG: cytochrome c peroxidase [Planctomycetota bacterium]
MKTLLLASLALAALTGELAPTGSDVPRAVADADFHDDGRPAAAKVELGRMLFFDKVLSGNRNISCATCHHPTLGTSDAQALAWGEGPRGLGADRAPGADPAESVYERVPRNAPALFNLGAREFTRMFHDGRVEVDEGGHYASGFVSPAKWKFPEGLDSALAAQAMFPVSSSTEMAGQKGENTLANAVSLNDVAGPEGLWRRVAARLAAIPEYVDLFRAAYPDEVASGADLTYVHAANAIAAFEATAFRADDSPFDRHLRGEAELTPAAARGLDLFYGRARCAECHSGPFQTDHDFHAIAMPQIGPGKADGFDSGYWSRTGMKAFTEDHGRGRVTFRPEDRFRFRTPSLRNVELTGPWGHDGAYDSLEAVLRHHLDPVASLESYALPEGLLGGAPAVLEQTARGSRLRVEAMSEARRERFLMRDSWVQLSDVLRRAIADANELEPVALTDAEVGDLLAFLRSLTDPSSRDLGHLVPERVPSGLPVED